MPKNLTDKQRKLLGALGVLNKQGGVANKKAFNAFKKKRLVLSVNKGDLKRNIRRRRKRRFVGRSAGVAGAAAGALAGGRRFGGIKGAVAGALIGGVASRKVADSVLKRTPGFRHKRLRGRLGILKRKGR